jgi:hypothetical protein
MRIDHVTSIGLAACAAAGVRISSHNERLRIGRAAAQAAEKIGDRLLGLPARQRPGCCIVVA